LSNIAATPDLTGIDLARVRKLEEAENARFVAERPSVDGAPGAGAPS
jgi:hypothetical protein